MQLSIIIVNYNVKFYLEQCLRSVINACSNLEAEILVVDNHSSDGSKDFFTGRFPKVRFFWKDNNPGFSRSNNEALKIARGEKVLFLNPDTVLPEDCLEKSLAFFNRQENIGALGVKMIDGSGNYLRESKRGFPTAFASFCKLSGLTRLMPRSRTFARYYLGHLPNDSSHEVDVISGAFMMVKKTVLDALQGFDEDYFMYAEDIDLSYRLQKAGLKNFYFAGTTIIHFKGESTIKQSKAYVRNFYGTMIVFVQKHFTGTARWVYTRFLQLVIALKSRLVKTTIESGQMQLPAKANVLDSGFGFEEKLPALQQHFDELERINVPASTEPGTAMIFCQPFVSFSTAIAWMQENKSRYVYFIHASGTRCIVGSDSSINHGIAIAI